MLVIRGQTRGQGAGARQSVSSWCLKCIQIGVFLHLEKLAILMPFAYPQVDEQVEKTKAFYPE